MPGRPWKEKKNKYNFLSHTETLTKSDWGFGVLLLLLFIYLATRCPAEPGGPVLPGRPGNPGTPSVPGGPYFIKAWWFVH